MYSSFPVGAVSKDLVGVRHSCGRRRKFGAAYPDAAVIRRPPMAEALHEFLYPRASAAGDGDADRVQEECLRGGDRFGRQVVIACLDHVLREFRYGVHFTLFNPTP